MFQHKICGIRSASDAAAAVNAGASAVGVICGTTHKSEDAVTSALAKNLVRLVPSSITTVLVTHLTNPRDIIALADTIGVDVIQLHGEISLAAAKRVRRSTHRRIIKAVHVVGPDALAAAVEAAAIFDALLLDSRTETRLGGTGLTHDWTISKSIVEQVGHLVPIILAGGLTPTNLPAAIAEVRPFGVDVNSGVEDPEGNKSREQCEAFVTAARKGLNHAQPWRPAAAH